MTIGVQRNQMKIWAPMDGTFSKFESIINSLVYWGSVDLAVYGYI